MSDQNDDQDPAAAAAAAAAAIDSPDESPVQRALRLKKARLDALPKPPRGGRFQREQAARVATGASRPWMKK